MKLKLLTTICLFMCLCSFAYGFLGISFFDTDDVISRVYTLNCTDGCNFGNTTNYYNITTVCWDIDNIYLNNVSNILTFNETKLNQTIIDLAGSGGNSSLNQSLTDQLYFKIIEENRSINVTGASINNLSHIQFNPEGDDCSDLEYCTEVDPDNGVLVTSLPGGEVKLQNGQELQIPRSTNDDIGTIYNGQVVYISGATGGNVEVKLVNFSNYRQVQAISGMVTQTSISVSQKGYYTSFGVIRDLNTNKEACTEGIQVFGDPLQKGNWTYSIPSDEYPISFIGIVLRCHNTEGEIWFNPQYLPRINDLSYVNESNQYNSNYSFLQWNNITNLWEFTDSPIFNNILVNNNITTKNIYSNFYDWISGDDWNIFNGSTLLFNESKLSTIYYNATSYFVYTGTVSGDLNNTQHKDGNYDGITFNITERVSAPAINIEFNFTDGIETFTQGIMRYKTELQPLTSNLPVIQLWDYEENEWENYGSIIESPDFSTIQQSVFDFSSHVQNGTVRMRIYKSTNGNTNNKYLIDWLAISKGYGVPAGEEVDPYSIHKDGTTAVTGNIPFNSKDIYNINNVNASDFYDDGVNILDLINSNNITTNLRIDYVNTSLENFKTYASTYFWNKSEDTTITGKNTIIDGGSWIFDTVNVIFRGGNLTINQPIASVFNESINLSNIAGTTSIHLDGGIEEDSWFNSGGNVGIGKTNPSSKLDVNGNITINKSILNPTTSASITFNDDGSISIRGG